MRDCEFTGADGFILMPAMIYKSPNTHETLAHYRSAAKSTGLNEDINPDRVRGIINAAPKYYPEFCAEDFAGIQPWRGLRPCFTRRPA